MSVDTFEGELFSQRLNPIIYDVYVYDRISEKAKIQIYHEVQRLLPRSFIDMESPKLFKGILNDLTYNYGVIKETSLINMPYRNMFVEENLCEEESKVFFLMIKASHSEYLVTLDIIELISRHVSARYDETVSNSLNTAFNEVFRKNGIGYELFNGLLISKDNEVMHSEIVKPSLQYLSQSDYAGANDEMLKAFSAFKESDYKNAVHNASKAFESTMKTIIEKKGWELKVPNQQRKMKLENASAAILIETIIGNTDIEDFNLRSLKGLKDLLQSLMTLRNNNTGHGQGPKIKEIYIRHSEFALHTTATNILYLIRTYG